MRRLWALIRSLPPDAALWRDIQRNPETPQEKYGSAAVSMAEFARRNQSALKVTDPERR